MNYYGKYRAIVKNIDDPKKLGRIKVKCPKVLGDNLSSWALPNFLPNTFCLPDLQSLVWIEFENGKKDSPIWTGNFYTDAQINSKFEDSYNKFNIDSDVLINSIKTSSIISNDMTSRNGQVAIKGDSISGVGYNGAQVTGTIDE